MRFNVPEYLYLLALVPALAALYGYSFKRKRAALAAFFDAGLAARLVSGHGQRRQWLRALAVVAAVGLLVVALMQPQWGTSSEDVERKGRDVIFILDVSLSMLAEDATPSRLERAKQAIAELASRLKSRGGYRVGLVAFAGRATLQCPLTQDHAFFTQRLAEVGPHSVDRQGTAIGDTIRRTLSAFGALQPEYTDLILLSDGEDHDSLPMQAAATAATQQVGLYTVGIGDAETGARIPVPGEDGARGYLERDGVAVRTRMRPGLLRDVARRAGGAYLIAGTEPLDLMPLFSEHIAPKPGRALDTEAATESYIHRFQWFVLVALALLAADMVLRDSAARKGEP